MWTSIKKSLTSRNKLKALLIIAVFSVFNAAYAKEARLSADALMQSLSTSNSASVANNLINDPDKWNSVLRRIATGDQKWLTVATKLKPTATGANVQALNSSVARALTKQPDNVMALIGKGFTVNEVCIAPSVEGKPKSGARFLKRAIKSVSAIQNNNLIAAKDACLKNLNAYLANNKNVTTENPQPKQG